MKSNQIIIEGARENNLKNISVKIPKNKLVVITGVSGSGKSSLAFDTVYAEGYRRYMENFSNSARFFLSPVKKPKVDKIYNLSPTIAIGQKAFANNPRSTVGTITGIYDYIKILFAHYGKIFCYKCGREMKKNTPRSVLDCLKTMEKNTLIYVVALWSEGKNFEDTLKSISNAGYAKVRIDKKIYKIKEINKDEVKWLPDSRIEAVVDRIILDGLKFDQERIMDSLLTALKISENNSKVIIDNEEEIGFNQNYICPKGCYSLGNLKIKNFSFNSPDGACDLCRGIGKIAKADLEKIIPNKNLSLAEGAVLPWLKSSGRQDKNNYYDLILKALAEKYEFSLKTPVNKLPKEILDKIIYGTKGIETNLQLSGLDKKIKFEGIAKMIEDKYYSAKTSFYKNELERYMTIKECPQCEGRRLKKQFLSVKLLNKNISQWTKLEIERLLEELKIDKKNSQIKKEINNSGMIFIDEIIFRLESLAEAGVGYLDLDRSCQTLSGGEFQKIRLSNQLNSGLSDIIYILDEPTVGLHSRDNKKLINTLNKIKNNGNSVIVIEHDKELIKAADYLIEIGPQAGEKGGRLVFQGDYKNLLKKEKIETADFLRKSKEIYKEVIDFKKRNNKTDKIIIRGAQENNLKNINVEIPLRRLVAVAGVSGSGKSSLIHNILVRVLRKKIYGALEDPGIYKKIVNLNKISKIINVDQSSLGKSSRSNPATYTGIFSEIRKLFSQTELAQKMNLTAGHFSFNMKGGRCEYCQGEGIKRMEMSFLEDVYSICPHCQGTRYNEKIRKIKYHGVNIAEVLDMNIDYAYYFFSSNDQIKRRLETLKEVGLGYLKLGQSSEKLSGGEAQRIKLASELARTSKGNSLYILDEPSIGLHFSDIFRLLKVLRKLVNQGNSVIIIEHNLDILEVCDWILELGPEGGEKGGNLVFEGTFDRIKKSNTWTGKMAKGV